MYSHAEHMQHTQQKIIICKGKYIGYFQINISLLDRSLLHNYNKPNICKMFKPRHVSADFKFEIILFYIYIYIYLPILEKLRYNIFAAN